MDANRVDKLEWMDSFMSIILHSKIDKPARIRKASIYILLLHFMSSLTWRRTKDDMIPAFRYLRGSHKDEGGEIMFQSTKKQNNDWKLTKEEAT